MFALIGMVHLLPLPGAVRYAGSFDAVIDRAVADARALRDGGIDALMIENYGDVPFRRGRVEPHTVSAMTAVAMEIRRDVALPIGINVLRNDPISALAIASAVGATMIRVNVHVGAVVTDQGLIQGEASRTLECRRALGCDVRILADVRVKHGQPLAPVPIEEEAADAVERGLADGLIVTGPRTGASADLADLDRVRAAVDVPIYVGSGVTPQSLPQLLGRADGAIIGTWLKRDGRVDAPVDVARVREVVESMKDEV